MKAPQASADDSPLYKALDPDDLVEFHAARILILIAVCGEGERTKRLDGATKLAKLDFFLRYPRFLERAHQALAARGQPGTYRARLPTSEAPMIRYRYGPWDPRYRQYVDYLVARGLARVTRSGTKVGVSVPKSGLELAARLAERPEFAEIQERAASMVGNLAAWKGYKLKDLIYELFGSEITDLEWNSAIQP